MKKRIAVITGTRAEYGLLYWTMKEIQRAKKLTLQLIVTGMHLMPAMGSTYKNIERDGFTIDSTVDMMISSDTPAALAKSMGVGMISFAQVYQALKPDCILVLGDRYEILAAVCAALSFNIPIAHIAGGEITEGAIDEQIRHAITKMAHIHFPCADQYAENIQNMGEEKKRICNAGHPGIEYIKKTNFIDKKTLFEKLNISLKKKTLLVTLHPTTLNSYEEEKKNVTLFFDVLRTYQNTNIVITYPNSDGNSSLIMDGIKKIAMLPNVKIFQNLGNLYYLSVMQSCDLVIGNSSSAIVEAPFFKIPVIDYGDRQKGRLMAHNILHVNPNKHDLTAAIEKTLYNSTFLKTVQHTKSLYGEGSTSKKIVATLEKMLSDKTLIRKKSVFPHSKKNLY